MIDPDLDVDMGDDNGKAPQVLGGKGIPDYHHALAIGGARHAFAAGHINKAQHDDIIGKARAALGKSKGKAPAGGAKMGPASPAMFGSLSPKPSNQTHHR